jgi:integrase
VWAFQVDLQQRGEPRRQVQRSGFPTKAAAIESMGKAMDRAADGLPEPSTKTVERYLVDDWLPSLRGRLRPGTWQEYDRAVRLHIVPHIGALALGQLTRARVKELYGDLEASGLSVKSVHNIHMVLHRSIVDAVEDALLTRNVADRCHNLPRDSRRELKTWSAAETAAFLRAVESDRLAGLWRVLATCGLRRGEALALTWPDFDTGSLSISRARVRATGGGWTEGPPKTRAGRRRVALDLGTVNALKAHRVHQIEERLAAGPAWHDSGLIFTRPDGLPLDPDGVTGTFERLAAKAKLPRIRLHDLRHGVASMMLAAGANPKVVQERLGHSSIMVTMDLYSHVAAGIQEDAAAALGRAIDSSPR